ncbi:DUF4259 domain-containing protein [Paenibacillus spongiae]|uniref:DUF4259 domain-containing protein n=1 Tax=Paenibacillus spongiae TaxID=2909671 RepID=A0ABY5SIP8_9BACL|nr:DUF4259 domain-containing protein [Paenibacillus spongiae]UVI33305.1 DUF4259 domain-containing protein [Paenibacillus spongiae]
MGAWDTGVFDNDGAGDCLLDVQQNGSSIKEQINYIQTTWSEEGYMEVDEGSAILALGELILIASGIRPVHPITETIDFGIVKSQLNPTLISQVAGLIRVALNSDNNDASEVYELWKEADARDFAAWKKTGEDILHQVENLDLKIRT